MPRRFLRRLAGELRPQRVEEAASCARALAAHVGDATALQLLPGGHARLTRAALTARVLAVQEPAPWPAAIMRQLDPGDAAFLPPLDFHPVVAGRERTLLGLPGRGRAAWVDAAGWIGVDDGPAVTVWVAEGRRAWPVGRRPDERGEEAAGRFELEQRRSDEVFGVITRCRRGHLLLELHHWPVVLEGRLAWALHMRLTFDGPAPRPARLGVAIRPAGMEGAAPIFHLARDADGLWTADGVPLLALAHSGDEVLLGRRGAPDPWHRFAGRAHGEVPRRPGRLDVRCPAGMASAVEVYRTSLAPGEPFSRLAVVAPPPGTPAALVRTSGRSLWSGAKADRAGILEAGSTLEVEGPQRIVEAARLRLLLGPARPGLAGELGAVALARLGFHRRAGDRLERWLGRVRRDGSLGGAAEAEEPAVLAWAAATFVQWTGNSAWLHANLGPWSRLLDRLAERDLGPGGSYLVGPEGSRRWSATWRAAALLAGAAALRHVSDRRDAWALAGGRIREGLADAFGPPPWSATEDRAADGAAAGMLAAAWLGLLPPEHPGVVGTLDHVRRRHWYGGGVLFQGGAHVGLTALLLAVEARVEGRGLEVAEAIRQVAALASSTGALPTVRHPARGAMFEGDDGLSAALFLLLVLDLVRVGRGTLDVLRGLRRARDLPTPFGPIDVDADAEGAARVSGRWRGRAPRVNAFSCG